MSTEEVTLNVNDPITTKSIRTLNQTPVTVSSSLEISYSIVGLSGAGSPQVTLVDENVSVSTTASYQIDVTGVAVGEYQYTVTGSHSCIQDSYTFTVKVEDPCDSTVISVDTINNQDIIVG